MAETQNMHDYASSAPWGFNNDELQQAYAALDGYSFQGNLEHPHPHPHHHSHQGLAYAPEIRQNWNGNGHGFYYEHAVVPSLPHAGSAILAANGYDPRYPAVENNSFDNYCTPTVAQSEQEKLEDLDEFSSHSELHSDFSQSESQATSDSSPATPSSSLTDSEFVITSIQAARRREREKHATYSRWTPEEDEALRRAVAVYGPHKWTLIASQVPTRSAMQCSTRWSGALNPSIHKGRWTPHEDAILRNAYHQYCNLRDHKGVFLPIPWNKIAPQIPNRTGSQCQARWTEALDPNVRKGKWSPQEDTILRTGVARYNKRWIRIAELIEGRTQRQCRTRWVQLMSQEQKGQTKGTRANRGQREVELVDGISTLMSFGKANQESSCSGDASDESCEFPGVRLRRDSVSSEGSLDGGACADIEEGSDEEAMY